MKYFGLQRDLQGEREEWQAKIISQKNPQLSHLLWASFNALPVIKRGNHTKA